MLKRYLTGIAALAVLLLLWHISSVMLDRAFLPRPLDSILTFFRLLAGGHLTNHILISAYRIFGGILSALVFALPTGLAMGRMIRFDRAFFPFISLINPIPKVVFLPVIIVLFGLGDPPKIFLIAIVVYFQLATVIRDSAKSLPDQYTQIMRSMNASRLQALRHLVFPYCLPGIFTSLRSTLGMSVAVLFIAETFASFEGLGYFISNRMDVRQFSEMYAGIIALSLFGWSLYVLLEFLEKRICAWNLSKMGQ